MLRWKCIDVAARAGSTLAAVVFSMVLFWAARGSAQQRFSWSGPERPPTAAEIEEARALFAAGSTAATNQRWADALRMFERAYLLTGRFSALFNLAKTLRAVGRHVEARDAFAQLLTRHADAPPEILEEARNLLAEESARVATLSLVGLPPAPGLVLSLDGMTVPDRGQRPLELDVDPGEHTLRIDLSGYEPWRWSGSVADGAREQVRVQLVPRQERTRVVERSRSIFSEPLFWVLTSVVLVAGAGVTAWLLYDAAQLDPLSPNVVRL
jgi:tetratricopeptide (TPR) repeat protein